MLCLCWQQDLSQLFHAAQILKNHLKNPEFKVSIEALTRVINLAEKATGENEKIDTTLFENQAEQDLYAAATKVKEHFSENTIADNYQALVELRPLIEAYFAETMVMVDDTKIRNNRLNQLKQISKMALVIASLDRLITK